MMDAFMRGLGAGHDSGERAGWLTDEVLEGLLSAEGPELPPSLGDRYPRRHPSRGLEECLYQLVALPPVFSDEPFPTTI